MRNKTSPISFFIIGLVCMLMVVSCCPRVTTSTSATTTDSTYTTEKPRVIEVKLPGDTVEITKWIECDSLTHKPKPVVATQKSGRLKIRLDLNNKGKLEVICAEDSLKQVIQAMDKTIFHYKQQVEKTQNVVTQFKTRRIDLICRWFAGIGVLLIAIRLYLRFIKPI